MFAHQHCGNGNRQIQDRLRHSAPLRCLEMSCNLYGFHHSLSTDRQNFYGDIQPRQNRNDVVQIHVCGIQFQERQDEQIGHYIESKRYSRVCHVEHVYDLLIGGVLLVSIVHGSSKDKVNTLSHGGNNGRNHVDDQLVNRINTDDFQIAHERKNQYVHVLEHERGNSVNQDRVFLFRALIVGLRLKGQPRILLLCNTVIDERHSHIDQEVAHLQEDDIDSLRDQDDLCRGGQRVGNRGQDRDDILVSLCADQQFQFCYVEKVDTVQRTRDRNVSHDRHKGHGVYLHEQGISKCNNKQKPKINKADLVVIVRCRRNISVDFLPIPSGNRLIQRLQRGGTDACFQQGRICKDLLHRRLETVKLRAIAGNKQHRQEDTKYHGDYFISQRKA